MEVDDVVVFDDVCFVFLVVFVCFFYFSYRRFGGDCGEVVVRIYFSFDEVFFEIGVNDVSGLRSESIVVYGLVLYFFFVCGEEVYEI